MVESNPLSVEEKQFSNLIVDCVDKKIGDTSVVLECFDDKLFGEFLKLKRAKKIKQSAATQYSDIQKAARLEEAAKYKRFIDVAITSTPPEQRDKVLDLRKVAEEHMLVAEELVKRWLNLVEKASLIGKSHRRTFENVRTAYEGMVNLEQVFNPEVQCDWYPKFKVLTEKIVIPASNIPAPGINTTVKSNTTSEKTKNKETRTVYESSNAHEEVMEDTSTLEISAQTNEFNCETEPMSEKEPDNVLKHGEQEIDVFRCKFPTCRFISSKATVRDLRNHYRINHPRARIPSDNKEILITSKIPRSQYSRQLREWRAIDGK